MTQSSPDSPDRPEAVGAALGEARDLAAYALAAPIAPIIALMALAALGLSGDPVHEPVHARDLCVSSSCYLSNPAEGAVPRLRAGSSRRGADGFTTATAQASAWSVTCGDARRLDRRLRCIPRMSHAVRIGLETCTISLGI